LDGVAASKYCGDWREAGVPELKTNEATSVTGMSAWKDDLSIVAVWCLRRWMLEFYLTRRCILEKLSALGGCVSVIAVKIPPLSLH
jgi:hypothetical protein